MISHMSGTNIRLQATLGAIFCCVLMIGGVCFDVYQNKEIEGMVTNRLRENAARRFLAKQAVHNVLQCRRYEKDIFLNIQDSKARQDYVERWRTYLKDIFTTLDKLREYCDQDFSPLQIDDWERGVSQYEQAMHQIISRIKEGELTTAEGANEALVPYKDSIRQVIDHALEFETKAERRSAEGRDQVARSLQRNMYLTLGTLAVSGLMSLAWLVRFSRQIARRTDQLQDYSQLISRLNEDISLREAKVSALLASSLDPMLTINSLGLIESASKSVEEVFGWPSRELVGKPLLALFPIPEGQSVRAALHSAYAGSESNFLIPPRRVSCLRRNGSGFPCEMAVWRVNIPGQEVPVLSCVFHDLSTRERHEKELRRFRLALDSSADAIFLIDPQAMRFLDVNATACRELGYRREELLSMGPHEIKPLMSKQALFEVFQKAIALRNKSSIIETLHTRKDGTSFPVEILLQAFDTEDGKTIVSSVRNLVDRTARGEERLLKTASDLD